MNDINLRDPPHIKSILRYLILPFSIFSIVNAFFCPRFCPGIMTF